MFNNPILQYGSLAAWPYWLAEGLTAIGQPSVNVIPEDTDVFDLDRRLPHHVALAKKTDSRLSRFASRAGFLARVPDRYSLVHYHGSHLLRGSMHHLLEGPYLAARKIPMLVSFGGGDARIVSMARRNNPYFYREEDPARDESIRRYLKSISRYIRYAATDCEMAEYVAPYFDKVFTFRQPVDMGRFSYVAPDAPRRPVLLHVPTEPHVKGTEQIVAAIEALRSEGLDFDFRMVRQLTQKEFYAELASCDVYIDELRCGSHGVTAVEAMACGKCTVTYIRPDLVDRYPADLPLVNANPDTITAVLRDLIGDADRRRDIAARSRAYALRYHDARVVAQDMLAAYEEIGLAVGGQ
ncbi:glycosyltransferase family protein [Devosia beringensis]|uniref:glycosyltransferase family protein n=1 Tax=Devosia beringensis TaxID=2657486 RepID=UPI00186B767B|nr:glycosyltransferase [Devosia beringensis]